MPGDDCNSTARSSADCRNESVGPLGEWSFGSHYALAWLFASGKLLETRLPLSQMSLCSPSLTRRPHGFISSNATSEVRSRECLFHRLCLRQSGHHHCPSYLSQSLLRSDRCKPSAHPRIRILCKLPRGPVNHRDSAAAARVLQIAGFTHNRMCGVKILHVVASLSTVLLRHVARHICRFCF